MKIYQTIGLLIIVGGLCFIAGVRVGDARHMPAELPEVSTAEPCDCCYGPLGYFEIENEPAPQIPADSERPSLVEFKSDNSEDCRRMQPVLAEAQKCLQEKIDVVSVDTDTHPAEAQKWRLRMIPTQILVDATGEERWRHEGYISWPDLQAALQTHLSDLQ